LSAASASSANAHATAGVCRHTPANCGHVVGKRHDVAGSDVNNRRALLGREGDVCVGCIIREPTVGAVTGMGKIGRAGRRLAVTAELVTNMLKYRALKRRHNDVTFVRVACQV
jgi:hypothetical protein